MYPPCLLMISQQPRYGVSQWHSRCHEPVEMDHISLPMCRRYYSIMSYMKIMPDFPPYCIMWLLPVVTDKISNMACLKHSLLHIPSHSFGPHLMSLLALLNSTQSLNACEEENCEEKLAGCSRWNTRFIRPVLVLLSACRSYSNGQPLSRVGSQMLSNISRWNRGLMFRALDLLRSFQDACFFNSNLSTPSVTDVN